MNYLVTTGLDLESQKFTVTQLNLETLTQTSIQLSNEAHDLIQHPNQKNICIALGRRPPINHSYILDLSTNQIIDTFQARPNYAFYGHGFWLDQKTFATGEVLLPKKESFIVLRDADNLNTIKEVIPTQGLAIHSLHHAPQLNAIFIAHNGYWSPLTNAQKANLQMLFLETRQSHFFHFPTPSNIGLQHLHCIGDWLYCLFRLGPDLPPGKDWCFSPLFKINLKTNEVREVLLGDINHNREFGYDGLSIHSTDQSLAITSQRGHKIYFLDLKNDKLFRKKDCTFASGVTPFNQSFHISSANGKLLEYNPHEDTAKILSNNFYASSHHQHFVY